MSRVLRRRAVRRAAGGAIAAVCVLPMAACGEGDAATSPSSTPTASSTADASPRPAPTIDGVAACPPSDPDIPARDDGLPDLTLPCLTAGPDVRLAGLRGTPTVINVWASWCPPCREEIPHLVELNERADGRVRILGIDLLDRDEAAIAVVEDFGMTYPSVVDSEGEVRSALNVPAPPVTLFVDSDGVIVGRKVGQIESVEEFTALVNEQLGVAL
jgi:thiol-disulfide isomerase/thioredoxin